MKEIGSRGKYSKKMFIGSLVAGIIFGIISEFFYNDLINTLPSVVVSCIFFSGLFLFLSFAIFIIQKMGYSRGGGKINWKQWCIAFVLIIVCSLLFEFLYGLIHKKVKQVDYDSYLFVIDNSGSMSASDPKADRYAAIEALIKDKPDDFVYGVMSFSDDLHVVRGMLPKREKVNLGKPEDYGGTRIRYALEKIIDEVEENKLPIDESCRVILLSDGAATDLSFFSHSSIVPVLNRYLEQNISISTVGLLYSDPNLMTLIADRTGGIFINVSDITYLNDAMREASFRIKTSRNLLGYRGGLYLNWLLGAMRIMFIAMLTLIIAAAKTMVCERYVDTKSVWISSAVGGIVAAFCIEIGMNMIGISPTVMRTLAYIMISFTLLKEDYARTNDAGANVLK